MQSESMKIFYRDAAELVPYARNAKKHPDSQVRNIAKSLKRYGWRSPVLIHSGTGEIIAGHGRVLAAQLARAERPNLGQVPCIDGSDLTEAQIREYRILDNKLNESEWDAEILALELPELQLDGFLLAFDEIDLDGEDAEIKAKEPPDDLENAPPHPPVNLAERYTAPPFSIIDTRQGYWQERKRKWNERFDSTRGRDSNLICDSSTEHFNTTLETMAPATSRFDPCLAETLYLWFCPERGKTIDPFAGGCVRGYVAGALGIRYTGIDIRAEQVQDNIEQTTDFKTLVSYQVGDSAADVPAFNQTYDFCLTCPPYFDLEVYSYNKKDLSAMSYDGFLDAYQKIIDNVVNCLSDNAFVAWVIGDVRDKKGNYRGLPELTVKFFNECGAKLYNSIILIEQSGTAALRAKRTFDGTRKVIKTHQNVLVFLKGDQRKIKNLSTFDSFEE